MSEEPVPVPPTALSSIISVAAHAPKEVVIKFLDVVSRGMGTAWGPADIALTAIARRFADAQERKTELARMEHGGHIAGYDDRRLLEPLLNYQDLRSLPSEQRLAQIERILTSAPVRSLLEKEDRKISNRADVIAKAATMLPGSGGLDDIPDDWINDFFYYAERVSDPELQFVWAKILAGRSNVRGCTRKRRCGRFKTSA